MIELKNSKDLQKQIPVITEKKLSQFLLLCTCILAAQTTNLSNAAKRMSKVIGKEIKFSTAYARLLRDNNNFTKVEFQQAIQPIYGWVIVSEWDYFRSGIDNYINTNNINGIETTINSSLSCRFPNPNKSGTTIYCNDLEVEKNYESRVYNLQGRLMEQKRFSGREFSINEQWIEGLYVVSIFEKGVLQHTERVYIK